MFAVSLGTFYRFSSKLEHKCCWFGEIDFQYFSNFFKFLTCGLYRYTWSFYAIWNYIFERVTWISKYIYVYNCLYKNHLIIINICLYLVINIKNRFIMRAKFYFWTQMQYSLICYILRTIQFDTYILWNVCLYAKLLTTQLL